jgi:hypothetical protein
MNITIINDCRDDNAKGRQVARTASLMEGNVSFVGVSSDLEAAGNLVDIIDAYGEGSGVVLVNVAPRNAGARKWPNGTPFSYFWYKKVLVVASIEGLTLSLVKKLKLVDAINVLDIPTVVEIFVSKNLITKDVANYIINTQFRSYEFLPRVASYLLKNRDVESFRYDISEISDAPKAVWWIDNFGNCKTTVLLDEINIIANSKVATKAGELNYYNRLKDVPDRSPAIITGSSGVGDTRFLEIVVQGESAAKKFNLISGDIVLD